MSLSHDFDSTGALVIVGSIGAAIGGLGAAIAAALGRKPSMAAAVDEKIKILIEAYDRHIEELKAHIEKLEAKIDALQSELTEANKSCRECSYNPRNQRTHYDEDFNND